MNYIKHFICSVLLVSFSGFLSAQIRTDTSMITDHVRAYNFKQDLLKVMKTDIESENRVRDDDDDQEEDTEDGRRIVTNNKNKVDTLKDKTKSSLDSTTDTSVDSMSTNKSNIKEDN